MREIESEGELAAYLRGGATLAGLRLVALDLRPFAEQLTIRDDFEGTVVLGGSVPPRVAQHLRAHGAILFPTDPSVPVDPYRGRLYHPSELYAGLAQGGYAATCDARAYDWFRDAALVHDAYATMLRAIHDDAMSDALDELLEGRDAVGIMGGHALIRGSSDYRDAAELGHRLAGGGFVVATGGGPGAMEAANLGAFAPTPESLDAALRLLAAVPSYLDVTAWADVALTARRDLVDARGGESPVVHSIGIPTWFYGHEPPNVFCDGVAKYFSNAEREDGLVLRSSGGIVVLPGAAGTVQEIFQAATPLYYASAGGPLPPLVLVGQRHWSSVVPVWPALLALAQGRPMEGAVHLVATVEEAAEIIGSARPDRRPAHSPGLPRRRSRGRETPPGPP